MDMASPPPAVDHVDVNGEPCRVWRKGSGRPLAFLAGHGGLPKWPAFLDRLAESHEVVAPSIPGYPGGLGHTKLVDHLDWVLAVRDLLNGCGLEGGDTLLAGSGPGASFALEVAALWPHKVDRLALIAPWGLFDEAEPMTDPWGQRIPELPGMLCADPENWNALKAAPEGANSVEWPIEQTRALEASARVFWPLGNSGLEKRLGRVSAPALLLWGAEDRILPRSYGERIAAGLGGPSQLEVIDGAGHLAELDRPVEVAEAIRAFFA